MLLLFTKIKETKICWLYSLKELFDLNVAVELNSFREVNYSLVNSHSVNFFLPCFILVNPSGTPSTPWSNIKQKNKEIIRMFFDRVLCGNIIPSLKMQSQKFKKILHFKIKKSVGYSAIKHSLQTEKTLESENKFKVTIDP